MPIIEANGIQQRYELTGEGPTTIVWVHGIGGSHHAWDEITPQFPGFRHLTMDVRGMGESEKTDGPMSIEMWARDLNGLMEALKIDRGVVIGHSMGGAISLRFAIDFPHRLIGLLPLSTSSRVGPQARDSWMKQADEIEATNPHLAAARRAVADYNMDEEMKSIRVPTLVIVGDADRTTPAGGSVIISRCIEDADLEIYPGIGHNVLKEEPKSIGRVSAWLEQFKFAGAK